MLRIVRRDRDESRVTLELDGRVVGEWVAVLKAACLALLPERGQVELHFADVRVVDTPGVAMLRDLVTRGVSVVNAAPTVATRLGVNGSAPRARAPETAA